MGNRDQAEDTDAKQTTAPSTSAGQAFLAISILIFIVVTPLIIGHQRVVIGNLQDEVVGQQEELNTYYQLDLDSVQEDIHSTGEFLDKEYSALLEAQVSSEQREAFINMYRAYERLDAIITYIMQQSDVATQYEMLQHAGGELTSLRTRFDTYKEQYGFISQE